MTSSARDIKFRAWDKEHAEWIGAERWVIRTDGGGVITYLDGAYNTYPLERFHLMQYTGLKDKNGVEIYEGDIVQLYQHMSADKGEIFAVEWDAEKCNYKGIFPTISAWCQHDVIGNIYENPELLGETS